VLQWGLGFALRASSARRLQRGLQTSFEFYAPQRSSGVRGALQRRSESVKKKRTNIVRGFSSGLPAAFLNSKKKCILAAIEGVSAGRSGVSAPAVPRAAFKKVFTASAPGTIKKGLRGGLPPSASALLPRAFDSASKTKGAIDA
jgi:hypothetical protein